MDCCSSGDTDDVRSILGRVAADVGDGRVFDALLGVGVFGLAGCGPVAGFGNGVDDEAGKGVCVL